MRYLFTALLIASFTLAFAQNDVKVTCIMPESINQGESFTIGIYIEKPKSLRNYASYNQIFPQGFTIIEKQSGEANFEIKNNKLTYTWFRMPANEEFFITFEVKPSEAIYGQFIMNGQYTYLTKNMRGVITTEPINLTINKINVNENNLNNTSISENKNINNSMTSEKIQDQPIKEFNCYREINSDKNGNFEVKIIINNTDITAVKIFESMPVGYKLKTINNESIQSSFQNGIAQFTVQNLEPNSKITLTYKINKPAATENPFISGQIIYKKDNKIVRKIISQKYN